MVCSPACAAHFCARQMIRKGLIIATGELLHLSRLEGWPCSCAKQDRGVVGSCHKRRCHGPTRHRSGLRTSAGIFPWQRGRSSQHSVRDIGETSGGLAHDVQAKTANRLRECWVPSPATGSALRHGPDQYRTTLIFRQEDSFLGFFG